MAIILGLALGLIVVGILMVIGSKSIPFPLLAKVVLWVGVALIVVGLILLLTPVLVWINTQIRSALGQ